MKILSILSCASLLLTTGTAFAGEEQQGQEGQFANLIVIQVPLNEKGEELNDQATMTPIHCETLAEQVAQGKEIDWEAIADEADQLALDSEQHLFDSILVQEGSDVPQEVLDLIDEESMQADHDSHNVNWRVWTPYGSFGNRGYYGYGYGNYYGYNYGRYPNRRPGRFGYYDGYNSWRYRNSGYHRYNNPYRNYYWYR